MPKFKRSRTAHQNASVKKRKSSSSSSCKSNALKTPNRTYRQHQNHPKPVVPFGKYDRILLVGEGDFSFARSLVVYHRCKNVMATCYDSQKTLFSKYPQAERHISEILGAFSGTEKGMIRGGSKNAGPEPGLENPNEAEHESVEDEKVNAAVVAAAAGADGYPSKSKPRETTTSSSLKSDRDCRQGPKVLFLIDARKLGQGSGGGGKEVRKGFPRRQLKRRPTPWRAGKENDQSSTATPGQWDRICFNFPHVGGLSTDVNRQARSNQELLVEFFKACVPLLSTSLWHDIDEEEGEGEDELGESSDGGDEIHEMDPSYRIDELVQRPTSTRRTSGPGQILVSLFEGEPYTLWNIRDLARHSGLRVVTSFRFPWSAYPGYSHARTLGEIESKHGGRGGWRGEDREARMYVFEAKQQDEEIAVKKDDLGKKRSRDQSDSDESDL